MRFAKTFLSVFLLLLVSSTSATGKFEVHDAWVREAPPKTNVTAAYLTLYNHSLRVYTLARLSSPDFKRVEMHRTEQHDNMTKMLPVPQVILNSKDHIVFQPGGMHLMLIDPKKRFRVGDNITLTLFFTDEGSTENSIEISLPVKKAMVDNSHGMHHNQHDSHSHQH